MYDYITGRIDELTPASVVVECGGIGYILNISLLSYEELEGKTESKIYTHQYLVRDDLPVLYGFTTRRERELFRMLIGVSGVGGGTARMVLSTYTPSELRQIISSGNAMTLKKVKGLGAKTAEKIIVELRDKIISIEASQSGGHVLAGAEAVVTSETYDEALKALIMLGFNKAASDKAVKQILKESPEAKIEEVIRLALKML
ncbi:MAG: Holliday junction branch migration protein RuvA [Rikenellaceae bacterium]|nr:Holliday junction branch migration protein RuvA [Rikenellaceae bacterium]